MNLTPRTHSTHGNVQNKGIQPTSESSGFH